MFEACLRFFKNMFKKVLNYDFYATFQHLVDYLVNMIRLLYLLFIWGQMASKVSAEDSLIEENGFHCRTKQTMRLNKRIYSKPFTDDPPYSFELLDSNDQPVTYYQPGRIYTGILLLFFHILVLLFKVFYSELGQRKPLIFMEHGQAD